MSPWLDTPEKSRELQQNHSSSRLSSSYLRGSVVSQLRRWQNKSTLLPSTPSTPLRHNETTTSTQPSPVTATPSTIFLPELGSTPPMPTFQKPTTGLASSSPKSRTHSQTSKSNQKTPTRPAHLSHRMPGMIRDPPPIADPGNLLSRPTPSPTPRRQPHSQAQPEPQPTKARKFLKQENAQPLPTIWSAQHDRAICVLDARDCPLPKTVQRLRKAFPELNGVPLTPSAIERRLMMLDQDVEVDHWRVGLAKRAERKMAERERMLAREDGAEESPAGRVEFSYGLDDTPGRAF